jgi:hypothetical protein
MPGSPISPLASSATLPSPNGRYTAVITGAVEIQMSGPTRGTLRVNGIVREHCNPSMAWSDDSEYLAVVEIVDRARPARLVILSMRRGDARYAPGAYGCLELLAFSGGVVKARSLTDAVEIDVSRVL